MKLSTKTRYSARILIELAKFQGQGAIQVSRIASGQKIPVKYLEQLLRKLKQVGLVESVRGAQGGHMLAKDPAHISLGELVRLFEGQSELVECITTPETCDRSGECKVRKAWKEATSAMYEKLDSISIADLISEPGCMAEVDKGLT